MGSLSVKICGWVLTCSEKENFLRIKNSSFFLNEWRWSSVTFSSLRHSHTCNVFYSHFLFVSNSGSVWLPVCEGLRSCQTFNISVDRFKRCKILLGSDSFMLDYLKATLQKQVLKATFIKECLKQCVELYRAGLSRPQIHGCVRKLPQAWGSKLLGLCKLDRVAFCFPILRPFGTILGIIVSLRSITAKIKLCWKSHREAETS